MKFQPPFRLSTSIMLLAATMATPLGGARAQPNPHWDTRGVNTGSQSCEGAIRVVVAVSDHRLPDANILIWPSTSERDSALIASTGRDGTYVHEALRPGLYWVALSGFDTTAVSGIDTVQAVRVAGSDTTSVDFLGAWRRDAAMVGTVTGDSAPLSHVLVVAVRDPDPMVPVPGGPYATVTDSDGRYFLPDIPPGTYNVTASDGDNPPRFGDATRSVEVRPASTETVPFQLPVEPDNWTAQGPLYWILGIALPLLMVGLAVGTVLINSGTRLSNVRRANEKLTAWLSRSDAVKESQKIIEKPPGRGFQPKLVRLRERLWLVIRVPFCRKKYLNDAEIRTRDRHNKFLIGQRRTLERQQGDEHRDVGSLLSGIWDGIKIIRNKGGAGALALGVATSAAAFVIVLCLLGDSPVVEVYPAIIATLGVVILVYVIGGFAVERCSRADRHTGIGAFAWGSAIPIYLGLNAIELSGFELPDHARLYDSQTIDAMFICVAMMLIVREVLYNRHVDTLRSEGAIRKEYDIVREWLWFAADGARAEHILRTALCFCYLLVVGHLLAPAILNMRIEGPASTDLVAVTSVVAVALLVPGVALFADGKEDGETGTIRVEMRATEE